MGAITHQLGFKAETTWGTPVVVDRFVEFTAESLERRQNIAGSDGIRPGTRYGRGSTRRVTRQWAEGSTDHEVATTGFGLFFHHLLGSVATVLVETGVSKHTATPGPLVGKGITLQKGVEKVDGTTQPFTYPGAKIMSADFSNDKDGVLKMAVGWDAKQELTATALATASYTSPRVFHYGQGVLKFAGSSVANVLTLNSLNVTNNLQTDRFALGNAGLKSEPLNRPRDTIAGSVDIEFANLTDFYNRFAADTSFELVLEYTDDVLIGATQFPFLRITLADCRLEGETPKVSGADAFPVVASVPFSAWDPTSGNAITIEYQTSDPAP